VVREFLEEFVADESDTQRRRRLQNELLATLDSEGRGLEPNDRLDREALHQRD
jgi:hypothetical protein